MAFTGRKKSTPNDLAAWSDIILGDTKKKKPMFKGRQAAFEAPPVDRSEPVTNFKVIGHVASEDLAKKIHGAHDEVVALLRKATPKQARALRTLLGWHPPMQYSRGQDWLSWLVQARLDNTTTKPPKQ